MYVAPVTAIELHKHTLLARTHAMLLRVIHMQGLLPVAGIPLIEYTLEFLATNDVTEVRRCT